MLKDQWLKRIPALYCFRVSNAFCTIHRNLNPSHNFEHHLSSRFPAIFWQPQRIGSAASEPGPGESLWCGSHELGPGPPLLALAWSCQWPTRGGALHPPRPSHCEGEKRGGAGASVTQIVPQIFSAGAADGFLLFLLGFFHKTNQKGFQSVINPSHNQSRRNNKNFSKHS